MADEVTVGTRGSRAAWTRLPTVTVVRRDERGAVAAEAAVVIPLLLAVTMALVWLVALAMTQVRVVDAARETARAAARGESDDTAVGLGRQVAPAGSRFDVARREGTVTVRVVADVAGPGGLLSFLPAVPVTSQAVAAAEPAAMVEADR